MQNKDRRSGRERRGIDRYPIEIDIEWEGSKGRQTGTLSDISLGGCFVLSSGDIEDGDRVRIFIPVGEGMKVQFDGKVANHVYEIGFAVIFDPTSAAQRDLLTQLIQSSNPT
jgi:hypothetical protein